MKTNRTVGASVAKARCSWHSGQPYLLQIQARIGVDPMCRSDAPVSAHSPDDYRKLNVSRIDFGIILTGPGCISNDPSVHLSRLITLSLKQTNVLG